MISFSPKRGQIKKLSHQLMLLWIGVVSPPGTWSRRTFYSRQLKRIQTWKLSISDCQKSLRLRALCIKMVLLLAKVIKKEKRNLIEWIQERVHLITFPQKFLLVIMVLNVICGQLDAFFTFCYVDIRHSTVTMIKKSYKWYKKENLISMEKNGMRSPKKLKIWSKNLFANQKND